MNIKEIRKEKKIKQKDLAKMVGIDTSILSRYEKGTVTPPKDRLEAIAKALDVSVDELMGRRKFETIDTSSLNTNQVNRLSLYNNILFNLDKVIVHDNVGLRKRLIEMSGGKCELCGDDAPVTDMNGVPYLELHFVQWLSQGGKDTADNAVVLCPNCHRKIITMNSPEDTAKLYSIAKMHVKQ